MKIAHLAHRCVPGEYLGGVERVILELAEAQAGCGAEVDILAFSPSPRPDFRTAGQVSIRYFPGRVRLGVTSSPAITDAVRAEVPSYDILHSHSTFQPLNREAGAVARATSRPIFYHAHGALDPRLFGGAGLSALKKKAYIHLFERPNLNRANAIFALSAGEKAQLRAIGVSAPIEVVPNGIAARPLKSIAEGQALRSRYDVAERAPVLLYMGRIVLKKRIEAIIEAFARLHRLAPGTALLIAGGEQEAPSYARSLRDLATELRVEASIRWLGFINEADKPAVLSAADFFIHASDSEGMAMAILEAMAAGLPTLVTPGCYMHDAVAAGSVLQTEEDPEAIAAGLLRLVEDTRFASGLAQAGQRYIAANHGWPALAKRVIAAYERHSSPTCGSQAHLADGRHGREVAPLK